MPRSGSVHILLIGSLAGLTLACGPTVREAPGPAAQRGDRGWRSLFDGATTQGWRGFREQSVPAGWQVIDGALTRVGGGGDLISVDQFGDFELMFEWKVEPCGNSGVMFRVVETLERTYHSGPEFQILDDACHPDGQSRLTAAGSNFGLHPAHSGAVRPAGEWNEGRLVARGAHVEHWLNGVKTVEYELWSADWQQRVENSKFVEWPRYGLARRGHLVLQDHGDRVQYRNMLVREFR